jgi:excisionase family DNA binding protein
MPKMDPPGGGYTRPNRVVVEVSGDGPTVGMGWFQPYDPPEVLTVAEAAQLLQVAPALVITLSEAGRLPGRKLGSDWRFSRTALVAWLAGSATR